MNVLHVEDSVTSRRMFAAQTIGIRPRVYVTQCGDLAAARKSLEEHKFDFAVLDAKLPDGLGAELVPLLSCPRVFVTSDPSLVPQGDLVVCKGPKWITEVLAIIKCLTR